jgi:1,4-alpha-glucan branching enzyme
VTSFAFATSWGATVLEGGGARYRLWAPGEEHIALVAKDSGASLAMLRSEDGWFGLETDAVEVGGGYAFDVGGRMVPDPAARAQIGDVHGPSRLVDPRAYAWRTGDWRG